MSGLALYTADVVALARKDLRLELRARDTLPAMLLFVLSTLAVFHFALPAGTGEDAAYGLLWIAIVFTALLGLARAWAPEREGGALDGLVLAPCDRSTIWLGKSLATLAFLAAAELVALPAFALFFAPIDLVAVAGVVLASIGICAVGSLLAAMAAASRGREVILPLLFLPLAIPLVVGGVGAGISPARRHVPVLPRPLRPRVRDTCVGHLRICRHGITSRLLAFATAGLLGLAVVLALLVAPEDADQGVSQKIFYFHVPIALTAYLCFGLGAWKALRLLWVGGERRDLESYTWIHQGTIFGALTLITGSIWARASWGVWWSWGSNQLVLFLVLFLFYCAYFMLRFSIDEGARRERICAVYALFGVALIPVSFFAIRLASDFIHPTVFTRSGPQMTHDDVRRVPRLLGRDHAARLRDVPRRARRQAHRREPARAAGGALVSQGQYVALAYGVVLVFVAPLGGDHRHQAGAARARDRRARRAGARSPRRWLSCSSGRR